MTLPGSRTWRWLFVAGGVLYFAGGAQHPQGTMAEMLANAVWVRGHATILVGLILMTLGLIAFRRSQAPAKSLDRWLFLAILATAFEAIEMAVHTAANVDSAALIAGQSTPVLTAHLWLATIVYPIFGVVLAGLVIAGVRNRELGSRWIMPLGLLGAAAHGVVMPLVHILEIGAAGILFPIAALSISIWFILAGLWRLPSPQVRDDLSAP
jgi:hypothetical protein